MVNAYRAYLSETKTRSAKGFVEKREGGAARALSEFSHGGDTTDEHRVQVGGAKNRTNHVSQKTTPGV